MSGTENPKNVLSLDEAAQMLGVSYSAVYKWTILEGKIPYINYGWAKRVKKRDIETYINAHVVKKQDFV